MNFLSKLQQDVQLGTFVKTPHPHIIEVLSLSGLDFLILDAEHAPFDRTSLDLCIMAARLSAMPVLVRIENQDASTILNALDCGATGIVVPHVMSQEQAVQIVKNSHYGNQGRGYAGSTRAAGYTSIPMAQHLANNQNNTAIIAQIEDPQAIEKADAIASVAGISALFIGQVDLAVAYQAASTADEQVTNASLRIIEAAQRHNKPVGMFCANIEQMNRWKQRGVSFFGLASEHKMMMDGFQKARRLCFEGTDNPQ